MNWPGNVLNDLSDSKVTSNHLVFDQRSIRVHQSFDNSSNNNNNNNRLQYVNLFKH